MRKISFYIAIILLMCSCMKEPEYNSLKMDFVFNFGKNVSPEYKENAKVTISNLQKSYSIINYTDENGEIHLSGMEPGFYRVQLSKSIVDENEKEVSANAKEDFKVFESIEDTILVTLSSSNFLVIKEFYYSGSLTPSDNSYYADQFVEVYNNSPAVQYADGLSIVEHESYGTAPNYWEWLEDTIVVKMIWTIPGEGTDYPIQPGESIVIARDAFDHQSDPLGNPLCPVDLAHADFEFFVYTASGDDIDGAYSPNMIEDLFTYRGNDISFHVRGGSAIALVQIPGNDAERKDYIANNLILKDAISSTRYYGKIPNEWVLDAVEVVFDEDHAVYKRFPLELDAGYTYNPEGSKSALSLRRKVKKVIDGRVIYQDSNNSCEDFIKGTEPKPWIYE